MAINKEGLNNSFNNKDKISNGDELWA